MHFFSASFCSAEDAIIPTPIYPSELRTVKLQNAIYDDLLITEAVDDSSPMTEFPSSWEHGIILYAKFNGNLIAGNVDAFFSQTSALRVKRRKSGTYNWVTIFEVENSGNNLAAFVLEFYDIFARSNTEYEYAIVPIGNHIEGGMSITSVNSQFDGMCIIDPDQMFQTELEVELSLQKNHISSKALPLASKYPYIVHNSKSNYASGTASGFFLLVDFETNDYPVNFEGGYVHRERLLNFLCNGKSKILKHSDGRMWLIDIEGNPTESEAGHQNKIITSFSWVESGDCEDQLDLYSGGFTKILPTSNWGESTFDNY